MVKEIKKEWKGLVEDIYGAQIQISGKTFHIPTELRDKVKGEELSLGEPVIATHDPKGNLLEIRRDPEGKKKDVTKQAPIIDADEEQRKRSAAKPEVHIQEPVGTPPQQPQVPSGKTDVHIQPLKPPVPSPTRVVEVPPRHWFEDEKNRTILIQSCLVRAVDIVHHGWIRHKDNNEEDIKERLAEIIKASDYILAYAQKKIAEKEEKSNA